MKLERIIVDADFCIKIGASPKYRYLERILPELAEKVYIHKKVYDEIIYYLFNFIVCIMGLKPSPLGETFRSTP